jgi:hypothetical protein
MTDIPDTPDKNPSADAHSEPPPELRPALRNWCIAWKTCLENVLSQVSGKTSATFEISAQPLAAADSDVWYLVVAGGAVHGEMTLRLPAATGTRLARTFLGETEPAAAAAKTGASEAILAFGERVDHAALYAIERILDCRTQPCVAGRKSVARKLETMRQLSRPSAVEFGPMNDLAEMARIAASYTARLSPGQVRLCRIGRFIWLRLDVGQNVRSQARVLRSRMRPITTNLVFRLQSESTRPDSVTRPFRDLHAATVHPRELR